MGHDAPYYWIAKHHAMPFFTTLPGGLTLQEHAAWIYFGGGQALWDELYAKFSLKGFLAGAGGCNVGGWFQKEIKSLEDLKIYYETIKKNNLLDAIFGSRFIKNSKVINYPKFKFFINRFYPGYPGDHGAA